jgi:hypothetical protein
MLVQLQAYVITHGHCSVPPSFKTIDGKRLGSWVVNQRQRYSILSTDQKNQLNGVKDWSWDPHGDSWNTGISELKEYQKSNGNLLVPQLYKSRNDFNLGGWIASQRGKFKNKLLPQEKIDVLNSFVGWVWNTNEYAWNNGYAHLVEYGSLNNNYLVKRNFVSSDGFKLGQWVKHQRSLKEKLSPEKREKLELLKDWKWSASDT